MYACARLSLVRSVHNRKRGVCLSILSLFFTETHITHNLVDSSPTRCSFFFSRPFLRHLSHTTLLPS